MQITPSSVPPFLVGFPRVETYAEIDEVLRSTEFHQGSHVESAPVYGGSLVVIDGPQHRERRRMLMALFTQDALQRSEREALGPAISQLLEGLKSSSGPDGVVRCDLVPLLRQFLIGVTAMVTGVDDIESPERRSRFQLLVGKLEAASGVEWSTRDHAEVLAEGVAARRELIRDYLQPSLDRRIAIVKRLRTGDSGGQDVPTDLLGVLAQHGEDGSEGEDAYIWRESALFLVAGTQTTAHSLPHVLWHLDQWWAAHPEDRKRATDIEFLRNAANESLRLHQPVPALLRFATQDVTLKTSGRSFVKGERIALFFTPANRDEKVFGTNPDTFNPHRPASKKPPPWGLSFGGGVHTCIGRALVTGLSRGYDDSEPTRGTIVGLVSALYQAGAELDPEQPARRNEDSYHDAFASMPIVLRNL